ncbi:MAG: D-2-hydroxyacid dehydrogenase [Planctomycetaceae bacterium]|nr:D-2-hydroxyacid dehydrogenase [Planctomycetaceae bacterium]
MKIVILDAYATNPGDLSWEPLQAMGCCEIYDRTPAELTVERAAGAEIVLTNKTLLPADVIHRLPKARYIGLLSTGTDAVDSAAAARRGIVVCNVPAYSTQSVAEMVFAHLLNLTFHAAEHALGVRAGQWARNPDFCYSEFPLVELAGKTMGIVGFGQIGQAVARIAAAMRMNVLVYTRSSREAAGVTFVDLERIFADSDVVSLHCPLTDQTRGMVNARRLETMKPSAFLINTSRGGVVDEPALAAALDVGRIAGAGLDVLSIEPPRDGSVLIGVRNCYVTPHIAWATKEARQRLINVVVENVRAFLAGKPQNVVKKQ